ncbi:hypothetical protein ACKWTF_014197 [Chironomus riparius]
MGLILILIIIYVAACCIIFFAVCCQSGNTSATINSNRAITYPGTSSQPITSSSPQATRQVPLSTTIPENFIRLPLNASPSSTRRMPIPHSNVGWNVAGSQAQPYPPINSECPYPPQTPYPPQEPERSYLVPPSAPQSTNNSDQLDDAPPNYEEAIQFISKK